MIEIGAVEEVIKVDDRVAIKFLGMEGARVLSTPHYRLVRRTAPDVPY